MCRRGGDPVDRRYLARREIAVKAVSKELDESDDCVERCPQLVRDVGEELALRLVRPFHVAVEPLEFDGTSSDVQCAPLLAQEAEREENGSPHTERPHHQAPRARRESMAGHDGPGAPVREANYSMVHRVGCRRTIRASPQTRDRVVAGDEQECDATAG